MLRKMVSGSLAVTALLIIGGCGGGGLYGGGGSTTMNPGGGFTTSTAITPGNATIAVGGTQQFGPMNQSGITYNWTSSNTSVATIDSNGLATGVAAGSTMISFTGTDTNSPYSASNPLKITTTPVTLTVSASGMVMGVAAMSTSTNNMGMAMNNMGMPIHYAIVTLVDAHNQQQVTTTDTSGRFLLQASGMSAPFLLKADDGQGHVLFGFATAAGVANITPLTDAMLRMFYGARGVDTAAAFANPAAHAAPNVQAANQLNTALTTFLAQSLSGQNLDPAKFDLVSTPFSLNDAGFDHVLNNTSVVLANGGLLVSDALADDELHVAFTQTRGTLAITTVNHTHQNLQTTTGKLVLSTQ